MVEKVTFDTLNQQLSTLKSNLELGTSTGTRKSFEDVKFIRDREEGSDTSLSKYRVNLQKERKAPEQPKDFNNVYSPQFESAPGRVGTDTFD